MQKQKKAFNILEKHYKVIGFEFLITGCTIFALRFVSAGTETTLVVGNDDKSINLK